MSPLDSAACCRNVPSRFPDGAPTPASVLESLVGVTQRTAGACIPSILCPFLPPGWGTGVAALPLLTFDAAWTALNYADRRDVRVSGPSLGSGIHAALAPAAGRPFGA